MLHTLQARTGASSRDMCQSEMDIIKKKNLIIWMPVKTWHSY